MESHEHPHEHHRPQKVDNVIAASVIVGAVLIAASMFYNTQLVIKEFGVDGVNQRLQGIAQNTGTGTGAGQPPAQIVEVAVREDAPAQGGGQVELVEFSDFQCPFCQRFFSDAYKQIIQTYVDSGKIKFTYRHYPLPFHANAQKAGEAAECANQQGKFVAYHDVLFTQGKSDGAGLDVESLKTYASDLGLNTTRFNACLDNGETAGLVQADLQAGQSAGVSGTPSFLLVKDGDYTFDVALIKAQAQVGQTVITMPNGNVFIVGAQAFATFQQAIDQALK